MGNCRCCRVNLPKIRSTSSSARPTLSQLWSYKTRRSTFLNFIKFADLLASKLNAKRSVGRRQKESEPANGQRNCWELVAPTKKWRELRGRRLKALLQFHIVAIVAMQIALTLNEFVSLNVITSASFAKMNILVTVKLFAIIYLTPLEANLK